MEAAEVTDTERCRCCMASGTPGKDLSDQYDWMGEKEVYADMLLESFDVTLSQTVDAGWKICDACVVRLRDSANFKKQVLSSEQNLLLRLGGAHESTSKNVAVELKVEKMKAETAGSEEDDLPEFETHFYDDEDELKDSSPVKFEARPSTSNTEMSNDEDVPLSALSGTKRKAPRAEAAQAKFPKLTVKTTKTAKVATKPKVTAKPVVRTDVKLALQAAASKANAAKKQSAQTLLSKLSARPIKITVKSSKTSVAKKGNLRSQRNLDFSTRPGTAISKHLSIAVVMHSNVTPFACRRGRKFRCIFDCCQDVEFSALRDHTRSKHATHLIHAVRGEPKTMLRVDITDLRCTICDHPIPDLELLESHLKDAHDLSTYKNTADVLVPYKLTEGVYRCQLCGEVSDNFPAIDTHMESHFPLNICEVCGRGFMSVSRLKTHSLEHAEKPFACETCQVTFVSESLKRRHVNYIHKGIGALICHMCPGLRFKDHKLKLDHMEQAHGREKRPTPTCSDCGKVFSYESSLTAHIKNIHQALKLNKCKLCDERFCIKKDLEKHVRLVHVAERLPCVYCDRSYTTVMELSKHMRKIHPDLERRCLCWDCGKPFENRLKLKQHRSNEHSSL